MKYSIRIITTKSPGLLNDANIYKKIFIKYGFNVDIYIYDFKNRLNTKWNLKLIDINLHLEHVVPNISYYAKINIYMPNQEFFLHSFKFINKIDYILCKTKIATEFFTSIKKSHKYKYRCIYTKFTTLVPYKINDIKINKDVNLFVHLAGKSPFKSTAHLVKCWLNNNGFISIDPNIKLYITCYASCNYGMLETLKKYLNIDISKYDFEQIKYGIKIGNMTIFTEKNDMYNELLINNSLAICISDQEGYGHYINEARYYKSAVLTVDHPPMNEQVHDNINGFTLKKLTREPKKLAQIYPTYKIYKVYPNQDELKEKIIYCILNKDKLINYGNVGHKMFLRDRRYFIKKMDLFIKYLLNSLDASN